MPEPDTGWNSNEDDGDVPPALQRDRDRCGETIRYAILTTQDTLVWALPGIGKSYSSVNEFARVVKQAAQTGKPVTILTGRGHKEMYDQYREWCDDEDLDHYTPPSATDDCPTIHKRNRSEVSRKARQKYRHGVSAYDLHEHNNFPCEEDGPCPWKEKWDFNPDDFDVLICHYKHAYVPKVTNGRVVIFDEFPGEAFQTTIKPTAISQYLRDRDGLPFNNYGELNYGRKFNGSRREALSWFEERGEDIRDVEGVLDDESGERHTLAPLAVRTLLMADDLGNGFERAELDDGRIGLHDAGSGEIIINDPPDLTDADHVVCLDGTPTKELWDTTLGIDLHTERVLTDEERREYVLNSQNLRIVQTTDSVLPYSSGTYVNPERDAALLRTIAIRHGTNPGAATSKSASPQILGVGSEVMKDAAENDRIQNYYGLKGSNKLKDCDSGAILGSPRVDDDVIRQWAAFVGEAVAPKRKAGDDFGGFGDDLVHHFRENEVLQAIFRFARQGDGAIVYVNTSAIPDWVPVVAGPDDVTIRDRPESALPFMEALSEIGAGRAREIGISMVLSGSDIPAREECELNKKTKESARKTAERRGNQLAEEGIVRKYDDPSHSTAQLYEIVDAEKFDPDWQIELPEITEGNQDRSRNSTLYVECPGSAGGPSQPEQQPRADPFGTREERNRWLCKEWPVVKQRQWRKWQIAQAEMEAADVQPPRRSDIDWGVC